VLQTVLLAFFAVSVAIMAISFWLVAVRESPGAELKRRLRQMSKESKYESMPEGLRVELLKETPRFEKIINRIPFLKNLDKFIDQCGLKVRPDVFLLIVLLIEVGSFCVTFVFKRSFLFAAFVAAGVFIAACVYIVHARQRRMDLFTEQLPDALTMIARSLRAGHSLTSAVELVGNESPEPLGGLFKTAYEQQKLGLWIPHALAAMLPRVNSLDLRFFVTAVTVHAEAGGNLSEILDKLAATVRERLVLRRQVQVYSAQGRLSGYILVVLPIVAFFGLQYVMMPGYEDVFLNETKGHYMIGYALVSQFIGYLAIRSIINIRI
jgi:tight adherence protein B